jgi:outer membrane receptor protein involved in Fe transport
MKQAIIIIAILLTVLHIPGWAQLPINSKGEVLYTISGTVIEKATGSPMHYATVRLETLTDKKLVTGIATDDNGRFRLEFKIPGTYNLTVNFIGFQTLAKEINIDESTKDLQLGTLEMEPEAEMLEDVIVSGEKVKVEYKIDKKIINVSDQYAAIGGTAVDVLENVPSVSVDIEGNVSLRGNSNFTVLIDGKPSVLEGSDALQSIPTGMIENIQIITNPSAKYNPEGTAGIINIITKKRSLEGISGIVNASIGLDHKYSADFLLNYRVKSFNFYLGGDYGDQKFPGETKEERITYSDTGDDYYLNSDGTYDRHPSRYGAKAGIDWMPNKNNTFRINSRIGWMDMSDNSEVEYSQWTTLDTDTNIYQSLNTNARKGMFFSGTADYTSVFEGPEHKLDMQLTYVLHDGNDESINTLYDDLHLITSGQRSVESGPAQGINYKVNYEQKFSNLIKMEAGAEGEYGMADEVNKIYYYNTETGEYELQLPFSHDVSYLNHVHGVYGLASGEYQKSGWQLGFRGEYTYRVVTLDDTGESFTIDKFDFFPTVHYSYNMTEKDKLMASYTRRIQRPHGWDLEPFYTWEDAYNIRKGNPSLKPQYINSYELSYQKEFGKNSISAELYYRATHNLIERVQSPYSESVTLQTTENVGSDYSTGTEIMFNGILFKIWDINLTANFFDYRVVGTLNDIDFNRHSFTWSMRMNNIFKLTKTTRLQINPMYHGPEVEAQETEKGFFMLNASLRQDLWQNKISLTLQARDILATGIHESVVDEPSFYAYTLHTHKAPMLFLSVSWKINNYNKHNGEGQMNEGEGEGEGD